MDTFNRINEIVRRVAKVHEAPDEEKLVQLIDEVQSIALVLADIYPKEQRAMADLELRLRRIRDEEGVLTLNYIENTIELAQMNQQHELAQELQAAVSDFRFRISNAAARALED